MTAKDAQNSWDRFLDTYEPLRSELYRYCRYLTRSPWDAEDLSNAVVEVVGATTQIGPRRRGAPSFPA